MRRIVVALIVLAAILGISPPAASTVTNTLLYPTSIHLVRGFSEQSNTDAVPAVQTQDMNTYDVDSRGRNGVQAVVYTFVVNNAINPPVTLSLDWVGTASKACDLRLSLWNFHAKRWAGETFKAVVSPGFPLVFRATNPAPFVNGTFIRGKIACTSRAHRFFLSTDRIRLPEDHN